jgi:ADP-dependent NAD(P)H-hydrate dehydratase / NAD(P)H-hydrate epimerase
MSASVNELLSTDEMAQADRLTIASGVAGIQLMENAGRAVADTVAARHRLGVRIAVVTGPGNNGGDGFVAARLLGERGYLVRVLALASPDRAPRSLPRQRLLGGRTWWWTPSSGRGSFVPSRGSRAR